MRVEGDDLLIDFPEGLWTGDGRTGPAAMRLKSLELGLSWLFREMPLPRFLRKCIGTTRLLDDGKLIQKVNSGAWDLEFLYELRCGDNRIFQCVVHSGSRSLCPSKSRLALNIDTPLIEYSWN